MDAPKRRHPYRLGTEAYAEPNHIAFITANTKGRQPCLAERDSAMSAVHAIRRLVPQLIAYCVMPDHVHFVYMTIIDKPLPRVVSRVKGRISFDLHKLGLPGDIWQRSCWDYYARDEDALWPMVEYVLNNPVRRELCLRREDWPYSGLCRFPW